jgi:outer membrane biosynthesis protein TonB
MPRCSPRYRSDVEAEVGVIGRSERVLAVWAILIASLLGTVSAVVATLREELWTLDSRGHETEHATAATAAARVLARARPDPKGHSDSRPDGSRSDGSLPDGSRSDGEPTDALPEDIRRVIRRHQNEVRFCIESGPRDVEASVSVAFVIRPNGSVASANAMGSTGTDPEGERCVATAVQRWTFPASSGGEITLRHRFERNAD